MKKPEVLFKFDLNHEPEHYLELWKWFTEDAAKIKDRMWTMATFFFMVLGGLLGFIAKHLVSDSTAVEKNHNLVLAATVIGCALSAYGIFMLYKYGDHIRITWNRADYIRFRIEGLSDIWCYDYSKLIKKDKKLKEKTPNMIPKMAVWLILIMAVFFLLFLGTILHQNNCP